MGYTMETLVYDPHNLSEMTIGKPVGEGLFQDWTLLAAKMTGFDEGVFLAVREHAYHPFVTERFGWRGERVFVVWSGTFHATLIEALEEFSDRTAGLPD